MSNFGFSISELRISEIEHQQNKSEIENPTSEINPTPT
jgi:hypothetical protein